MSPPLTWSNLPAGTKELAVVCEDPDAGNPPPFVHWVIYKIPPTANGLPEEHSDSIRTRRCRLEIAGAIQGVSGFRRPIYRGPAPPPGKTAPLSFRRLRARRGSRPEARSDARRPARGDSRTRHRPGRARRDLRTVEHHDIHLTARSAETRGRGRCGVPVAGSAGSVAASASRREVRPKPALGDEAAPTRDGAAREPLENLTAAEADLLGRDRRAADPDRRQRPRRDRSARRALHRSRARRRAGVVAPGVHRRARRARSLRAVVARQAVHRAVRRPIRIRC